jgi:O-antigen/teichoic acid export membrane protein
MNKASLKNVLKKVIISLAEQGLYSFPNFLLNILLARWLSSEEYGSFAFGFSILLLLSGFHTALILEPMIVFGPSKYSTMMFSYLKNMVILHVLLTTGMAFFSILVSFVIRINHPLLADGLLGAAISLPFILLFWLFRRACYMYSSPQIAAQGSLLYMLVMSSIFLLRRHFTINVLSAFLIMSIGSLSASLLVWFLIKKKEIMSTPDLSLRDIWPDHWQYGKWASGSGVVSWLSSTVTIPLLGIFLGLSESGIFRALQNLILPLQQISAALDSLFVPWLSGKTTEISPSQVIQKSKLLFLGYLSIGLGYLVALIITNPKLVELVYGSSQYSVYSWMVIYFGFYAIIDIASHGLSTTLRAIQKPNSIFWALFGSALMSLAANIILIPRYGLAGASYTMLMSGLIMLVILIHQYRKQTQAFRNSNKVPDRDFDFKVNSDV